MFLNHLKVSFYKAKSLGRYVSYQIFIRNQKRLAVGRIINYRLN